MTAMPATIDRPALSFAGLHIFIAREGTRVTGRVDFPYAVAGARTVNIDYHSKRPDGSNAGGTPSKWDRLAEWRADVVVKWKEMCERNPDVSKTKLADQVAASITERHVSGSAIRVWSQKYDSGGVNAIRDRYVSPPKKSLTLEPARAEDCVLVCAWWAFRIGDTSVIDTKMMHAADALLDRYDKATILPTIDCYYAWPCDRDKFRFKTFERWARYDFQTWLFRACDENDYRRAVKILEGAEVRLLDPPTVNVKSIADGLRAVPDVKTRQSDVLHRANRSAMHSLSLPKGEGGVRVSSSEISNLKSAVCHCSVSSVSSVPPEPTLADLQTAKRAQHIRKSGFHRAAIEAASKVNTGVPAVAHSTLDPPRAAESLSAFVASLNDDYRRMLLRAAQAKHHSKEERLALQQIAVTWNLWFERLPTPVRNQFDIDLRKFEGRGLKTDAAVMAAIRELIHAIAAAPSLGADLQLASRIPVG